MRLTLSTMLVAAAAALPAQTVTLRGVAFDSLHNTALGSAFITLSGAGKNRSATADSTGHFFFDDVAPGAYRVSMQHAAIDSLGFPGISTRATVTDGKQEIVVALPSFASMWRSVCGGTSAPADSGFLFGVVRNAIDGRGVPRASVDVSWIDIGLSADKKVTQKRWRRTARADSTGSFGVCGVPVSVALTVQATADTAASGVIDLAPTDARVVRRDLLLGSESGKARGVIAGFLKGEAGRPYRDARVTLEGLPEVRSGDDGRFVIRNAPLGTRQIEVNAIGMMPLIIPVDVTPTDTAFVDAVIRRVTTTLDPVKVKATARLAAFNRDLADRRKLGFGTMMDSTKLVSLGTLANAFASTPSVKVQRAKTGNSFTVWMPSGPRDCLAIVWLDGRRSDYDQLNDIQPQDLALVEVYPHRQMVPDKYTVPNQGCGAILLWTKFAVSP